MQTINTILIDDELSALAQLERRLHLYSEVNIIAQASNGQEAIEMIEHYNPFAIFLDIEMPLKNGFEVALQTKHLQHEIIFTSAYNQYAIDAFEIEALDYLLKPISQERLGKTIHKLKHSCAINHYKQYKNNTMEEKELIQYTDNQTICINHNYQKLLLKASDITHIIAEDGYSNIYLSKQGQVAFKVLNVLSDMTLKSLMETFNQGQFIQIHRSILVHQAQINSYFIENKNAKLTIKEDPNKILDVSRSGLKKLKATL